MGRADDVVPAPGASFLNAIGLGDSDERVYRSLITRPGVRLAELAAGSGVSLTAARRSIKTLQDFGLASRSALAKDRYRAAPPEVAVSALVHKRHRELESVRLQLSQLQDEFRAATARDDPGELVEVASGREAFAQRFAQLQRIAVTEVRILDRPPYADTGAAAPNSVELEGLKRGVRYRTIYDREALEVPGFFDELPGLLEAGEEARTTATLPMKLAIADRGLGLLPLRMRGEDMAGLLVHSSPLLDALGDLFELLWERAVPIGEAVVPAREDASSIAALSDEDRLTLTVLAAGLTDEVGARQLGIAVRTMARRVKRVMGMLGVTTRFQAGMAASRRGWV